MTVIYLTLIVGNFKTVHFRHSNLIIQTHIMLYLKWSLTELNSEIGSYKVHRDIKDFQRVIREVNGTVFIFQLVNEFWETKGYLWALFPYHFKWMRLSIYLWRYVTWLASSWGHQIQIFKTCFIGLK